jgi:hypothetical protein
MLSWRWRRCSGTRPDNAAAWRSGIIRNVSRLQIHADDPVRPVRHVVLVVLTVLLAVVASSSAAAVQARVPAQTKKQAELNVLRALPRAWRKRLPDLVDRRTHLTANNTQAICRGRGKRYTGRRYARFVCVIRPAIHRPHKGLYVSYRALRHGRFRMHWLAYKH